MQKQRLGVTLCNDNSKMTSLLLEKVTKTQSDLLWWALFAFFFKIVCLFCKK